jgi:hypothetical protein
MDERQGPLHVVLADAVDSGRVLEQAPAPSQTLLDLAGELTYFTTAPLQIYGGFDRDACMEYVLHNNPPEAERPFAIDCEHPFFQGLPATLLGLAPHQERVAWNHRIYAIPTVRWEDCREFIACLAVTNTPAKRYTATDWHEVQVVDPLSMASGRVLDTLPLLTVVVFTANTNHGFIHLAPAKDPPRTRPYPFRQEPRAEIVTLAKSLFAQTTPTAPQRR